MECEIDQRIINTKKSFYTSLLYLIQTKTNISVLSVCRQANKTSMTFYHHYSNIQDLIQETIIDQLSLRLPIPIKLKPSNTRQLLYYLIRFLNEFCNSNQQLIINTIKTIYYHFCKNTYLDLLIKTINRFINQELKIVLKNEQPITINICSDLLTFGLIGLFFKRIMIGKSIEFETIKTNINIFINNFLKIN